MQTLCTCEFPAAVNKCDEHYHCDRCGYPLSTTDRRHALLRVLGLEIWSVFVYRTQGYRRAASAWDWVERQFGIQHTLDPPPRRRIRFFSARLTIDPERE
jgi:hypothetical protein